MEVPYIVHGTAPNSYHIGARPNIKPELVAKRAEQDRHMAGFHAYLDAAAKDTRMKYERPSFAVVGEGSASSQERYRQGWDAIFGKTPEAASPRK